jgi:hypothetical protein
MIFEYATTSGESVPADQGRCTAPKQPDGDGWEPFGSDTVKDGFEALQFMGGSRFVHFWYWRRRLDGRPCTKCGAVARTPDGECIGCGRGAE